MTNREAIEIIKSAQAQIEWEYPMEYAAAFDMAILALQARELSETQKALDTISKQTTKPRYIDANEIPYCEVLDADTHKGTGRFMADKKDIDALPSAQPDGIPLEWIDKHLEWLDNCDNDFAQLAKVGIRAMVEIWKKDKT